MPNRPNPLYPTYSPQPFLDADGNPTNLPEGNEPPSAATTANATKPSGVPAAKPAVTPAGGTSGLATAGAPIATNRPANVYLNPQEQQAILRSAGYPGGTIVSGQAIPQPKIGTNNLGQSTQIDTGEYQVSIQDAQGRNVGSVTVTKGATDDQGNTSWGLSDIPKAPTSTQSAPTDFVVKTTDQGVWYPDDINNPGGGYHQILPPGLKNEDEEILKAVNRQVAEGNRNAKQRNEQATGFYVDDDTLAQIRHLEATDTIAANSLKQRIANETAQVRIADAKQATDDRIAAQNILQSKAQTGLIGANTAQVTQATDLAKAKAPIEIDQAKATLAATQQNTQIAAAPTLQGGVTGSVLTTVNPLTGAIDQSQMNKAFQPKTQAEIAGRVGQIQALMTQMGQDIQGKVDRKEISAEQGLQQFNAWYDQNVGPQMDALQAAQDEAQFARGKELATMRTAAQTAADAVGAQAMNVAQAAHARSYLDANANPVHGSIANVQAPDYDQIAKQATMEALKYIDPTAAAAAGGPQPNLRALDIQGMLNRTNYLPQGGPAVAGPASAPGAPGPAAPSPGGGVNGTGQGIGANPMAAAMARMFQQPSAEPAPEPAPVAAAPAAAAYAPAPQPRAPMPVPTAPGNGYDPSAMAGRQAAPGLGYDPSNIALQPAPNPTPGFGFDPSAMAGRGAAPGLGYDPSNIALAQPPAGAAPTGPYPYPSAVDWWRQRMADWNKPPFANAWDTAPPYSLQ